MSIEDRVHRQILDGLDQERAWLLESDPFAIEAAVDKLSNSELLRMIGVAVESEIENRLVVVSGTRR